MSDQRKRRQFLADALFAGGSLAAASMAMRWFMQKEPEPQPAVAGLVAPVINAPPPTPPPQLQQQLQPRYDPNQIRPGGDVAPGCQ